MKLKNSAATGGFSLVESSTAIAISALFLGSVFAMNVSSMGTIRCAKESVSAGQVLQQRIESLRIANWQQVTNASWLSTNLMNANAKGAEGLKGLRETLTLTPYNSASSGGVTGNSTTLTRTSSGTTIVNQNTSLLTTDAVKVVWTTNFTGAPNGRPVSRQIVAILAKGGVAR